MDDGPANLQPLQYAPTDTATRHRRIVRRGMLIVVLIALAVFAHAAWRYAPTFAANWAAWSEQRAWIARPPTGGALVLEDTRSADMDHFPERAIGFSPRIGTDMTLSVPSPGPREIAFDIYSGRARSDDGVDCFVSVRVSKLPLASLGNRTVIDVFARTLGSPFRQPQILGTAYEFVSEMEGGRIKVFRPIADPADPSHLALQTRWNGEDRWLDIWITNGGKTVRIERRLTHPQLAPATGEASRNR